MHSYRNGTNNSFEQFVITHSLSAFSLLSLSTQLTTPVEALCLAGLGHSTAPR